MKVQLIIDTDVGSNKSTNEARIVDDRKFRWTV